MKTLSWKSIFALCTVVLLGTTMIATPQAQAAADKVICVPWQGDPLKYHTAITGTGTLDMPVPDSIIFEMVNTRCGYSGTFTFYLNGVLLGTTAADPGNTCTCTPPLQTYSVTDTALLSSAWNSSGDNILRVTKSGYTYIAIVRARLNWGADTQTVCIYNYAGGDCDENSLCDAAYVRDSIDASASTLDIDQTKIRLKGVIKTTDTSTFWYKWVYGDGTESAVSSLSGKTKYNVEKDHTYIGAVGTPFTAQLLVDDVDDSMSNAVSDNYFIKIEEDNLDSKINIAIDNGLWYLYKSGANTSGNYHTFDGSPFMVWSYSSFYASPTASAIHAFQINGHKETGDPAEDPYAEYVEWGLNWLFNGYYYQTNYPMLKALNIATVHGDNPDSRPNGKGIEVRDYGYRPIYEGGMIMDAIIASGTPDADSGRDFDGDGMNETYQQVLQDMVDMYAYGQYDGTRSPYGLLGGWRYSWDQWPDNSACQWAAIGMIPAEEHPWNCTVPNWVKTYNDNWLNYSHYQWNWDGSQNIWGGFGYTGSGWGVALTPSGMVQLDFCGMTTSDPRWVRCERWLADNWKDVGIDWLDRNNVYAYYTFAKAMRLAQPDPVVTFSHDSFDWYRGSGTKMGLAEKIANRLVESHYWDYYGPNLGTAWCVIILKPVLFAEAPIACFDADPNPNYPDMPIYFDPFCSGHSEAGKDIDNLTLFEWDWDNDGVYDESTTTPEVVTHSFSCPAIPCTYPVTLRVTDDSTPARTATYVQNINITNPPHPPVAKIKGPYMVSFCQGDTLVLDGSDSFDPDEGVHEAGCLACPSDTITAWEWDLDGAPFDYTDETGEIVDLGTDLTTYFPTAGNYDVGLKVTDNTAAAYPTSGESDFTDEDFTAVEVYDGCICEITAIPHCQAVTLSWDDVGADHYNIYVSTQGVNLGFEDTATTTETTKTMGSVVMGATTYYRVMAVTGDEKCLSGAVSVYADPELCNPTSNASGTYVTCIDEVVILDGSGSTALVGTIVAWDWDLDDDGEYDDAFGETVEWTWNSRGVFPIGLKVTSSDSLELVDETETTVEVGLDPRCNQPPVAICQDVTVAADENCQGIVAPEDVNNWSSDPDGDPITLSLSPSGPYPLGTTTVTLTVTDDQGASDQCTATVTVVDTTPPSIVCPADVTLECPADTSVAANGSATASDNCGSVTITHSDDWAPACGNTGMLTRTWTATDASGNSSSCVQMIIVVDTTPPIITCPGDVTLQCPADTSVAANGSATASDTCGSVTITHSDAWAQVCGSTGTLTRTWAATDDCGNISNCEQIITVEDTTGPVISNLNADYLLAAIGQTVTFSADVLDDCDAVVDVEWNYGDGTAPSSNPGHEYGQANIYTVIVTATDDCGNSTTDSIIIVVYDPSAGFTSGGGWFVPDSDSVIDGVGVTDLVSKANFGFIVKYKKGADNPDGNLEFQYKAGDINLHSTDMEWLVVQSETKVRFKGKATINGEGLYTFKVTAEDNGEPGTGDWFKIEIWIGPVDTENGPPTPKHKAQGFLGGGNIQIHQK